MGVLVAQIRVDSFWSRFWFLTELSAPCSDYSGRWTSDASGFNARQVHSFFFLQGDLIGPCSHPSYCSSRYRVVYFSVSKGRRLKKAMSWGEVKRMARNRIRWWWFVDAPCPLRDNRKWWWWWWWKEGGSKLATYPQLVPVKNEWSYTSTLLH